MATRKAAAKATATEPRPILTVQEGADALRIYNDDGANDEILEQLIAGIPDYIQVLTGYPVSAMTGTDGEVNPMVKTLAKLILQLWYNPDGTENMALTRTVNSMAKAVKAWANGNDKTERY